MRPFLAQAWVGSLLVVGCGGGHRAAGPAQGGTDPAAVAAQATKLTPQEAQAIIDAFHQAHPPPPPPAHLAQPSSQADVLEILKRDQLDLFAYGVEYIEAQGGPEAEALHAQIELAWGEACSMAGVALGEEADRILARAAPAGEGGATLRDQAAAMTEVSEALMAMAEHRYAIGKALAEKVIAAAPDSYLGYRVAADYHRLQHQWEAFDQMVAKIEATNPDSNGLLFLRGAAAAQRDFDFRAASEFYRQALQRDPQFIRAQMALMLGQSEIAAVHAELQKLKALNPDHYLVRWTGAAIEADYQQWRAEQAAAGAAPDGGR